MHVIKQLRYIAIIHMNVKVNLRLIAFSLGVLSRRGAAGACRGSVFV